MLAIAISSFGPPQVLKPVEVSRPNPADEEVLIQVKAAGVARADSLQRQGKYPPPSGASEIPGLDVAGIVDSVGRDVRQFQPGDRVCAILSGGGYAEYCAAPELQVLPIPDGWTDIEAATLPENLFTVFDNLITRASLKSNETILIHGGTSGIGSTAIMLSTMWGAKAIATAGSEEKCQACLSFGAAHAINYRSHDFVSETQRLTDGHGVNVVLDLVGGPYLARNIESLALDGRISIVATQGGSKAELDIGKLMKKRARILGSTMRSRSAQQKGEVAKQLSTDVWPLLRSKQTFRPVIDSTFPLAEAWRAHQRLEEGSHIGKIVLTV